MATYPQYDSDASQVTENELFSVGNVTDQTFQYDTQKEESTAVPNPFSDSEPQGDPETVTQRRRLRTAPSNTSSRVQKQREFARSPRHNNGF